MNNEIKEILESIQYAIDEDDYWEVTKETLKPLLDYITNLQQENERKERLITQYGEGMCAYANRIDKAIEYIKEHYPTSTINYQDDKYNLLNILQNGSDS